MLLAPVLLLDCTTVELVESVAGIMWRDETLDYQSHEESLQKEKL